MVPLPEGDAKCAEEKKSLTCGFCKNAVVTGEGFGRRRRSERYLESLA